MKVTIEGYGTLTGRPATILRLIQDAQMFNESTGDEFIETIQNTAWRCFGVGLQVTGNTYEERAESLIREAHRAKMLTIIEE